MGYFNQIVNLIEKKIGLKPESVSRLKWEWILKERMTLCGASHYEDYFNKLMILPNEVQELIELIVVQETWFFRDKYVYEYLKYFIHHTWLTERHERSLRILSIPSSTGEEPYSIAMTLLNEGMSPTNFSIDAGDISKKGLAQAQIGLYYKKSFRSKELDYRDRYFVETQAGYALQKRVKESVHFFYLNLLDENLTGCRFQSYDLIFFRNLLIYLDHEAQRQAFNLIKKLLAPQGRIIVGSVETSLARKEGLYSVPFPRAYVFSLKPTKKEASSLVKSSNSSMEEGNSARAKDVEIENKIKIEKQEDIASQRQAKQPLVSSQVAFEFVEDVDPTPEKTSLIQEATKLADDGCFEEATNLCLKYINRFGFHSQVYYLLGLIQHASGHEDRAEEFFQKAVYLNPVHYEALVYLSLLFEKKGEKQKADLFRQRAQKIHKTFA